MLTGLAESALAGAPSSGLAGSELASLALSSWQHYGYFTWSKDRNSNTPARCSAWHYPA